MNGELMIDPEFRDLLPPHSPAERDALRESLQAQGCLDKLKGWREEKVLLDGHNRYKHCNDLGVPFEIEWLSFPSRRDALNWVIENQLSRRNLTPLQAAYLRGKRYNNEKADTCKRPGNQNASKRGGKICHRDSESNEIPKPNPKKTAERLAEQDGVSPRTIQADAAFANGVDYLEKTEGRQAKEEVLAGKSDLKKTAVRNIGAKKTDAERAEELAKAKSDKSTPTPPPSARDESPAKPKSLSPKRLEKVVKIARDLKRSASMSQSKSSIGVIKVHVNKLWAELEPYSKGA